MRFFLVVVIVYVFNNSIIAAETNSTSYINLGILKPFWKNRPLIGRWLSSGYGLMQIPDYLQNTSFPYKKRPYKKEIPFADGLAIVRLLGGWDYSKKKGELNGQKEADIVYIRRGKLHYRWQLLAQRLNPYIDAGYTDLTLVLDNIPWDFPKNPKLEKYGQVSPPRNLKKWETFLEAMVHELIRLYGYDKVNNFRFRLGTEWQGRHRFNGSQDDFHSLYRSTYSTIKKILPQAMIAPFNHGGKKRSLETNNVSMTKFISDINTSKINFLPVSFYYLMKKKNKSNMKKTLDSKLKVLDDYFKQLDPMNKYPKEIHEFGILNYTTKDYRTGELGVRGASWKMYLLQSLLEKKYSRLYHWNSFDKVSKNKYLLQGSGWNNMVLDHLIGGKAYSLPSVSLENVHHKTLFVKKINKAYLLTTVFPDESDTETSSEISIAIPKNLLSLKSIKNIKITSLSSSSSVHDIIQKEFYKKNLLKKAFKLNKRKIGRIRQMGGQKGINEVINNWKKYTNKITTSLTLKPYQGNVEMKDDSIHFSYHIEVPSVSIIVLEL